MINSLSTLVNILSSEFSENEDSDDKILTHIDKELVVCNHVFMDTNWRNTFNDWSSVNEDLYFVENVYHWHIVVPLPQ